jgi:hypothetical protein
MGRAPQMYRLTAYSPLEKRRIVVAWQLTRLQADRRRIELAASHRLVRVEREPLRDSNTPH